MSEALFDRPFASMADLITARARERPDAPAFAYVPERGGDRAALTYAQVEARARAVAVRLLDHAQPGDRALLLFPPGLDCVVAFFACLLSGVVAVPLMVPRRSAARDFSEAILADCTPRLLLTSAEMVGSRPDLTDWFDRAGATWLVVDAQDDASPATAAIEWAPSRESLALLQYTSGSTSTPKGVMVSHGNILANLEMIQRRMGNPAGAISVNWVPLYHDMGLMMGVMQPLYLGGLSVLLAPASFIRRPLNWLRAIHEYRAAITSAPNFAFDLCVSRFQADAMKDMDLSCWQLALNGAEPIHGDTIDRFNQTFAPYGLKPGTMYPGYGLAEATLLVTGSQRGAGAVRRMVSRDSLRSGRADPPRREEDGQCLVSSGRAVPGSRVVIVDPDTQTPLPPLVVGEVRVHGAHVAQGYWRNVEVSAETFPVSGDGPSTERALRTGDLGFVDKAGELFLTGRIKDLVIIRGMNHYPADIERTVQDSHEALRRDCGAAFAVTDDGHGEKLVIVQEVERTMRQSLDAEDLGRVVRAAVTKAHDIAVHAVVFIRPASLPKTTSGKIQRGLTRRLWTDGRLDVIGVG